MKTPDVTWMALFIPPERLEPLEVKLPDDTVRRAVWTGAKWWCEGQEVTPRAWRPLYRSFDLISA